MERENAESFAAADAAKAAPDWHGPGRGGSRVQRTGRNVAGLADVGKGCVGGVGLRWTSGLDVGGGGGGTSAFHK